MPRCRCSVVVAHRRARPPPGPFTARYGEPFGEATDLVGLGAANAAAAFSGTFVVNGSPTKTQIADSAGGRSQLSQLTAFAVVLLVLMLLTGPLAYLPDAALAAVVFVIAIELIDLLGMRRILALRKHEFAVALLTMAAVVALGVEYGIVLAIIASIIEHLRHSYSPLNCVLVKSPKGTGILPGQPGARTREGLVAYPVRHQPVPRQRRQAPGGRRGADRPRPPAARLVIDCAAIGDVDYTAYRGPGRGRRHAHQQRTCAWSSVPSSARCGSNSTATASATPWVKTPYFDTPGEALDACLPTVRQVGLKPVIPAGDEGAVVSRPVRPGP